MRLNAHAFALLLPLAIALAFVAAPAAAQPHSKTDDLARARALDREGAKAYGEGRYNDAIRYFEEALRLGGPPFELWNIAKCHLRLDQPEQAADFLERYLATPNLPKDDREEASQQLEALKKRPSTLTVSSTPSGAQVTVDGKSVEGRTPLSVSVPPGGHTVTVSSAASAPYTRQVEARYGRAVIVDASMGAGGARSGGNGTAGGGAGTSAGAGAGAGAGANAGAGGDRPPPPDNPYDQSKEGPISLRGAFGVAVPRHGSIGGSAGLGFLALGTYRLAELGNASLSAGGLLSISHDSWDNRTNTANVAPGCATITDAQSGTAMSLFAIGTASFPVAPKVRVVGIVGAGVAGYFVGNVGGDLFVPSCRASPGARPAVLFGAQIDYAIAPGVRLSAFPLTWQIQPAFEGTRAAPRDASGIWMRFGIGIGAGVDL